VESACATDTDKATSEAASASAAAQRGLGVLLSVVAEPKKLPGSVIASLVPDDGHRSAAAELTLANWQSTTNRRKADGTDSLDDLLGALVVANSRRKLLCLGDPKLNSRV
jgi:hypothetical protein